MNQFFLTFLIIVSSVSCNSQGKKTETAKIENSTKQKQVSQIGQYVVETFQASKGNLWFGTLEKGAAKYNGKKLIYLTTKDGLPSNRITNIIEDKLGNLWNCNYEKDGKKYDFCLKTYSLLESDVNASQEKAIERAKKLLDNLKGLTFHEQNPVTLIYKLVDFLNKNCRK